MHSDSPAANGGRSFAVTQTVTVTPPGIRFAVRVAIEWPNRLSVAQRLRNESGIRFGRKRYPPAHFWKTHHAPILIMRYRFGAPRYGSFWAVTRRIPSQTSMFLSLMDALSLCLLGAERCFSTPITSIGVALVKQSWNSSAGGKMPTSGKMSDRF
jgi:hypothetical protein